MSLKNQRKSGMILSYVVLVLDTFISIVYTPILLKSLGDSEYGLYQLIGSLVNYFAVMDLGLGGTITRYMIKYSVENDTKKLKNFFAMAIVVYSVISSIIICGGSVIFFNISNIFNSLSVVEIKKAQTLFLFLILNLIVTLFDHAFAGALQAYEQFAFDKGLKVIRIIVRAIVVILLLNFFKSSVVIVAVDLVLTSTILFIKILVCTKKIKVKPHLYKWDNHLFKEVFGFTLAIFLQAIINQFNNNVDKTVLGIFSTTAIVTVYSVAMQIYSAYSGISTAIQSVYLPKISKVVFSGANNHKITESLVEPSRLQFTFLFAVCSCFWLYGKTFINLWCGKTEAWLIACIVMTAGTVELFQNTTTSVLKAKNLMRGRTLINLFTASGNFLITVLLVPKYGMLGAAAGTAFTLIFGYIICNNLYYKYRIGIEIWFYFKEVLRGLLPASIIGTIIGALPKLFIKTESWILFFVECVWFVAVYFISIFLCGLRKKERQYLIKHFKHIIH